jgi:hypothetical protein
MVAYKNSSLLSNGTYSVDPYVQEFTPNSFGDYVIRLSTYDGCSESFNEVTIYARCPNMVAAILPLNQTSQFNGLTGDARVLVTLNGTQSTFFDTMKAYIKVQWAIVEVPPKVVLGSDDLAILNDTSIGLLAGFRPSRGGTYKLTLTLSDQCQTKTAVTYIFHTCVAQSARASSQPRLLAFSASPLTSNFKTDVKRFESVDVTVGKVDYVGYSRSITVVVTATYTTGRSNQVVATEQIDTYTNAPELLVEKIVRFTPTRSGSVFINVSLDDGCQEVVYPLSQTINVVCNDPKPIADYPRSATGAVQTEIGWSPLSNDFPETSAFGSATNDPYLAQGATLTYTWSKVDGSILALGSTKATQILKFKPTGPGTITLQLSVTNGCGTGLVTIAFVAKCIPRQFSKLPTDTVTLPVVNFAVIPGAFWLSDSYVQPLEKFPKQAKPAH